MIHKAQAVVVLDDVVMAAILAVAFIILGIKAHIAAERAHLISEKFRQQAEADLNKCNERLDELTRLDLNHEQIANIADEFKIMRSAMSASNAILGYPSDCKANDLVCKNQYLLRACLKKSVGHIASQFDQNGIEINRLKKPDGSFAVDTVQINPAPREANHRSP
jgi:hypothetical protein